VSGVLAIQLGDGYIVGSVGCRYITLTRRPRAIVLAIAGRRISRSVAHTWRLICVYAQPRLGI
jgi:hypothetical protein